MKRSSTLTILFSMILLLLMSCNRNFHRTLANQSIRNICSLDETYIKDTIDLAAFEKRMGAKDQLIYRDSNDYRIIMNKRIDMVINQFGEKISYSVVVTPPKKYYYLYQAYDAKGAIRQRWRKFFLYIELGQSESYDANGGKQVELFELPVTKFTLDDVYTFMKRRGWVDDNGKDRDYITVIPPNEEKRNWKIRSWNADRYWVECELHRNTGRIIHLVEEYRMPR